MSGEAAGRRLLPMRPRDPREPHRAASSLELFFDLVFVVAVSIAAGQLHHAFAEDHVWSGLPSYAMVFFAIWWAWMNFTWFATSFDTDDWLYRVLTILQMSGVLVLAAGVEPMFTDGDFRISVVGYVLMRVAMIAQWLRAARSPRYRRTALRYAAGIAVVQVLWLLPLLVAPGAWPLLLVLVAAELAVPVIAERPAVTPWHAHHITERYGLFTLILLGESLLASANAVIAALHADVALGPLLSISAVALLMTAALWWIYFWPPHHTAIRELGDSLEYGYGHYVVFAAAGAFSAGVELQIDVHEGASALTGAGAVATVTVPVALFVAGIWWLAIRENADPLVRWVVPVGAVAVLLCTLLPGALLLATAVLVAVVVVLVLRPPVPAAHPARPGSRS